MLIWNYTKVVQDYQCYLCYQDERRPFVLFGGCLLQFILNI